MHITQDDVAHIAALAKLKFSPEELKKFLGQMNDILDFFETLRSVDTEGVAETAQVTGLKNITRKDEIEICESPETIIALTPNPVQDNMIALPRIM